MQYFMKKEDKSMIYVENVETTYFDNCAFFAALASFLLQFCLIHFALSPCDVFRIPVPRT